MPESNRTPTPETHYYPASPDMPMVQQAMRYHHLTSVPPNWVTDSSGNLIDRGSGRPIGVAEPDSAPGSGFWGQLAHASPYIAAALGMGFIPGASAVGGGAGAGVEAGAVSGLGSTALPGAGTALSGAAPAAATAAPAVASTIAGKTAAQTAASYGAKAVPIALSLMGNKLGGGGGGGNDEISRLMTQFPQLKDLLDLQTKQAQRQDPLHDALTQLGLKLAAQANRGPAPEVDPIRTHILPR